MRTAAEIAFRVRQEVANIRLWARPPAVHLEPGWAPRFPAPDARVVSRALAGSDFANQVIQLASEIRAHRFPLLGLTIDTGPEIRWRRDYQRGVETGLDYCRLIPYLDADRCGDHKIIWELNRHQHLVTLAQAYLFSGDPANLAEICSQLDSWIAANPCMRGINWASALEVALRSLSWIWVDHLVGPQLPADFRAGWHHELYRHGRFLENNLSVYFSPNTHLLGEAMALHALGLFFAPHPDARRWEQLGELRMHEQIDRQVRADGSHIEQSTYYHVYALDMFLLHAILGNPDGGYLNTLSRMADYLDGLLGPSRTLAFFGDDDGGRLFHPFGPRDQFARATLATASAVLRRVDWSHCRADLHPQAAWWLGVFRTPKRTHVVRTSRLFLDAGLAVMAAGENQIILNAGSFGPWSAGHSHAGALSIVARSGSEDILIDPGTYTYTADPAARDWFRGTEAHNTVRIDGLDQATPAGPFRWTDHPQVQILSWDSNGERDTLGAECRYAGFTHRRRIEFHKPGELFVIDEIDGPPGEHDVEQLWHLGSAEARDRLVLADGAECVDSWRSRTFGERHWRR